MEIGFTPLFTGGSGRSGTTIILNLLKDHPQVHSSLPREIKYLTSRFGLIDLNFGRPISLEEDFKSRRNNLAAAVINLMGLKKEQFLFNLFSFGLWYFYDLLQILGERESVQTNGSHDMERLPYE